MPPPNDHRPRQITEAAAAVFARSGFHAATVRDIAAEAGISLGLLYRYFGGKDDLVVALVETYVVEVHAAVERADTLADAVEATLASPALGGGRTRGALFVEVMAEALRSDRVAEVVRRADTRVSVALADRVRSAQRAGEVAPELDPDAVAEIILALGDGLALRTARTDEPDPAGFRAALDALVDGFLRPVTRPGRP